MSNQAVALEKISREVDIDVINYKIQEIGELATYEYMYTDAGKFENPQKIYHLQQNPLLQNGMVLLKQV